MWSARDQRGEDGETLREIRELTIVADAVAVDVEVNAGLEDGVTAGVAVDTDPRGRRVRTGAAGGLLGGRDGEGAGYGLVGSLMRDKSW